jgi:hypothetical protein
MTANGSAFAKPSSFVPSFPKLRRASRRDWLRIDAKRKIQPQINPPPLRCGAIGADYVLEGSLRKNRRPICVNLRSSAVRLFFVFFVSLW